MKLTPLDIASTSRMPFELSEALERGHDKRGDEAWLAARLTDPVTEFIPVWQSQNLVTREPVVAARLHVEHIAPLLPTAESVTYLGWHDDHAVFTVALLTSDPPPLAEYGEWVNMRVVGELLSAADWATMGYARAMVYWHERHRFCGVCGSSSLSTMGGHVRRCTNAACATETYPRTDPCIIVLVFSGDKCLLGRQHSWPVGRYSTLAGFIEPGESADQAVAREVYEEAGVKLKEARYYGSQSWPFPASLMLGFHAEAATEEIHLHDGELGDARWFTRQELRDALTAGSIGLPTPVAISHRLISAWFNMAPVGGNL
jgi:NAD+ diphosphatase